ncbi:MAG: hypothetical protein AAFQ82_21140, partial [Myxococcota bacterium]
TCRDADWSVGGQVDNTWKNVTLGATVVSEFAGGTSNRDPVQRYGLVATSLKAQLSSTVALRLDVARSEGQSHSGSRSSNGGLCFEDGNGPCGANTALLQPSDGIAAAMEMTAGAQGFELRAYGRFQQAGFSDSRTTPGERRLQLGARSALQFRHGRLWGLVDHLESRRTELDVRNSVLLGASHRIGSLVLSGEGRITHRPRAGETGSVVGAQAAYPLGKNWTLTLRRAQPINAPRPGESALGAELGKRGEWNGRGEFGADDQGVPFGRAEIGVPLDGQDELYGGIERRGALRENVFDERSGDSVLLGGRRRLNDGTRLYAEQRLSADGAERRVQRTVGFDLPRGSARYFVNYARTAIGLETDRTDRRDGLSTGVVWGGESLRARASLDARRDDGESTLFTLGGSARVDYVPKPGVAFGFGLRGGEDLNRSGSVEARSWEGTAGFAWRAWPQLTWFGRLSFDTQRLRAEPETSPSDTLTHVAASALAFDLVPALTLTPKASLRRTRIESADERLIDRALLTVLRADYHLARSWDVAIEARRCASAEDSANYGALAEASLLVLR